MAETEPILPEATPPARAITPPPELSAIELEKLERWWEERWKRYAENKFKVIMPLWLRTRTQPIDDIDKLKRKYRTVYDKVKGTVAPTDDFSQHVATVVKLLGYSEDANNQQDRNGYHGVASVGISEEACAKILEEMDEHRSGAVDGHVDLYEAAQWWSRYTDDESLLEQAWQDKALEHDAFGNLDLPNLAKLIGLLLKPTKKEASLAVWAACGDCFGQDGSLHDILPNVSEAQNLSAQMQAESSPPGPVDRVAAWLMKCGEASPRDPARVRAFLNDKSAISSIFAQDADGPSDKDQALHIKDSARKASVEQQELSEDPPLENAVARDSLRGQQSVFDHFFDQWMRMHRTATDTNFIDDDSHGQARHPKQRFLEALNTCGPRPTFEAVIEKLLEPTEQGLENMRKQIDVNNDGRVDKTEVLMWWRKNCSPDVRVFQRAWLQADKNCDDELSTEELKALLGFNSIPCTDDQVDEHRSDQVVAKAKYPQSKGLSGLIGLRSGETSSLIKSLDDDHQPDTLQNILAERPPSHGTDGSARQFAYTLRVTVTRGTHLQGLDRGGTSDPYVVCKMSYSEEAEKALVQAKEEAARTDAEKHRQAQVGRSTRTEALQNESDLDDTPAAPEPEPADAGEPARFFCQFGGEGEFVPVWLSLSDIDTNGRLLEIREDSDARALLREADISGCKVMRPIHVRQVSQLGRDGTFYTRRLDLARRDSEGDVKYIIATECCETLDRWISLIDESEESQPLTLDQRKKLTKLYRQLIDIRKLATVSYCSGNVVEAAEAYTQAVELLSSTGRCHLCEPKTEEGEEDEQEAQKRVSESGLSRRSHSVSTASTSYLLEFTTADETAAGTDAQIYITLFGTDGGEEVDTGEIAVPSDTYGGDRFETGQVDTVVLENVADVGELSKVTVRSDGSGWGAGWLLDRVVVRPFPMNGQTASQSKQKAWTFPCKRWLQVSSFGTEEALSVDLFPTSNGFPTLEPPTVIQPSVVSRSGLLCGRARCWKKLALRDDKSTDELMQLWRNVRDDAAAATLGLQHKDTAEADQLHAEATIKLTELISGTFTAQEKEGTVLCQYDGEGQFNKVELSLRRSIFAGDVRQSTQTKTTYELEVVTGAMHGAGTDARVFVTLFGKNGSNEVVTCKQQVPWTKDQFEAGKVDRIRLENVTDVGELTQLTIEHDGTGLGSGWYLESINVKPINTGNSPSQKVHFPCHKWLDEAEGDGKQRQDLFPETPGVLVFKEVQSSAQSSAEWAVELYEDIIVSEPSHRPENFPFALQLKLRSKDSMGNRKYVIATESEEQIAAWKAALSTYGRLQAKAVESSGYKVLQKTVKGMKPQKTQRIKKTNDAYWDETFTFEWSCTRQELSLLQLKLTCMDWNAIGKDSLIGECPKIDMLDVFERIGTPECYSQPKSVSLNNNAENKTESQRGVIDMYIVLEEHLSRPVRSTLYPTYMNEKFLCRHVQHPLGSNRDEHSRYALDVCLLGFRGLKEELRQPSVEIIVNGEDRPSVVDQTFSGKDSTRITRYRESYQSKRLYTVGQGLNPSLADFEVVEQELVGLSSAEIKRRAILAGVRPPSIDEAIRAQFRQAVRGDEDIDNPDRSTSLKVRGWSPTAEDLLQGYKNVQFSHPTDPSWYPKSLTIRIWHKPLGSASFLRHQPAELYAQTCIPLIQRKVSKSAALEDAYAQEAIQLYQEGMRLLHTENESSRQQTLLYPSGSQMEDIKAEMDVVSDRISMRSNSNHDQHNSKAIMSLFEKAADAAAQIDNRATKNRVLTKLHAGIREAKLQRKYGQSMEEWLRGREVLEGTWESSGSSVSRAPVFGSWELSDESRRSSSGTVRCAFRLGKASEFHNESHHANAEWKRVKQMTAPKHVVVRVYVVRGRNLRAMDRNNMSDPYLTCTLTASGAAKGSTERQMLGGSEHRVQGTLNPEFRQVFEFKEILMPGCAKLKLSVKDWDALSLDDDIGYTDIDLEHRYFCNQWNAIQRKPLETRELIRKSSKQNTYGNGSLQLWVDIIPTCPTASLPPLVDISLPDPENFQLRVIVWNAEDMKDDSGSKDEGDGLHMNDLYFSGHLQTKVAEKVANQSQETDVHWRAKGGIGEFNYRFVYDFAVDPRLPVRQPCSFTLKAWDKDPLTFKSDFLGQRELDLSELVENAMLQLQDEQRHVEKMKELLASGRIDEMVVAAQKYRVERQRKRVKAEAVAVRWANHRVAKGLRSKREDSIEGQTQQDNHESLWRGCVRALENCFSQSRIAMTQNNSSVHIDGGLPEDRAHKYKWDHARQWMLRDIEGTHAGTVWVSVELLHQSIIKNRPVGKGRDAPNEHPVLEDPEREHLSLTSPLGALRFFVGPARLKVARVIVIMVFVLGLAWTVLSTSIDTFVRRIVLYDMFSVFTATCPAGFAVASAVHASFCGDAEFNPQIDHWLKCLGPYVTLDGLDSTNQPDDALCRSIPDEDGVLQYTFNWELCENSTKTCNPGLQRQLDMMHTMTRERQQSIFDHECEFGGSHYNLVMYSPDCQNERFRGARSCDNEPCRSCVSATDGACIPGRESSFLSKFIWRVLIPAVFVRLVLLITLKIAKMRSPDGPLGLCHRAPVCKFFFGIFQHCREVVSCGRTSHCNRRWARRIRKLATWTIILFAILYATMLCDAC